MSNLVNVFKNSELGIEIRMTEVNGEPHFVAVDITNALGYANGRDAVATHVDEEDKGVAKFDTLGGKQNLTMVTESGMYSLILGSQLPSAKTFKRWITKEVLPSIRKNGMYAVDELLDNPEVMLKTVMKLKEERDKRVFAERQVAVLAPKAEAYHALTGTDKLYSMSQVATMLRIRDNKGKIMGNRNLFKLLREENILKRNNEPFAEYNKYFTLREVEGENFNNTTTKVTYAGIEFLRRRYKDRITD